ncbi:MAG: protease complex subunit PrcB family protein [Ignavibacteria bacterium]|nr:protease complex subunit PrcB family protein [Ignavibacteria bacterium]
MKTNIILLTAFIISTVIAGCSSQGNDEKKLPMEIILDGTYSAIEEKREILLNNNDDYQKLMTQVYSNLDQMPRIPVVDFNKNSVVAVFIGNRSNGGYMVVIDSISEGSKNLTVNITETTPGKNCMVTDAITRPFSLVKIPKTELKPVFKTKQIVKDCQ